MSDHFSRRSYLCPSYNSKSVYYLFINILCGQFSSRNIFLTLNIQLKCIISTKLTLNIMRLNDSLEDNWWWYKKYIND